MCTHLSAGQVEPPTKFSEKMGEGGGGVEKGLLVKKGVTFFRGGGCNFIKRKKLKSEIFNDKKSL